MILVTLFFLAFILWAVAHVGVPRSISSLYYYTKTKWTYTMVLPIVGLVIIFTQTDLLLQAAAATLIIGTSAPDYEHRTSLSKYLHYGFTALTAMLAWWAIGGVWMALAALLLLIIAKLLSSQPVARNAVFWAEIILFDVVFVALIMRELYG